jgi:phosphoribosylformylglycinamidine cyclo-ligase
MYNIFNMGIGMTIIVSPTDQQKALEILEQHKYNPIVIGVVTKEKGVKLEW